MNVAIPEVQVQAHFMDGARHYRRVGLPPGEAVHQLLNGRVPGALWLSEATIAALVALAYGEPEPVVLEAVAEPEPEPAGEAHPTESAQVEARVMPQAFGSPFPDEELEDATVVAARGRALERDGVKYVLEGVVPAYGMLGFLVAYAKVGKTTFGQVLAAHVAAGRRFLDRVTVPTKVLILAAEDPPEYTAWLARHLDVPPGRLTFRTLPLLLHPAGLAQVVATVKAHQFGLVLIASWQAVVRGLVRDENDNAGAVLVVENVKAAARESGIPWLIDAHSGKGEDQGDDADPTMALRGASSAAGAADYVLSLRYGNGAFGTTRRLSGKGRFVSFAPITMEFDAATSAYSVIGESPYGLAVETTWRQLAEMGAVDSTPRSVPEIAVRGGLVSPGKRLTGSRWKHLWAVLHGRPEVAMSEELRRGQKTTLFRLLTTVPEPMPGTVKNSGNSD